MSVISSFTGWDYLRIMCGVFFLPHCADKIFRPQGPLGFFGAAGFKSPRSILWLSLVIELAVCTALLSNVFTRPAAILAGLFLLVAAVALVKVSKREWLWNKGGSEYPVFWALCCFIVAGGPF